MKIGIVTTFFKTTGGISTFVKNVVTNSSDATISPIIFSPDVGPVSVEGCLTSFLCPKSRLSVVTSLVKQLLEFDVRFVQCHGTWYLLFGCLVYKYFRRLAGVRVRVVTIKHTDLDRPSYIKRLILQVIDNASDGIVFVSNYLREKYQHDFGFNYVKPLKVVHPGCGMVVVNQTLKAELAARLGFNNKRPLLTYIGLFQYPGKVRGLILLLESVALLKKSLPSLQLAIAGRGCLKAEVIAAIERLSLQGTVMIIEDLDTPYELLQLSDLHCHISLQDNFPLVVLEALSSGTPVVASEVGELPNIGIEGLIIAGSTPNVIKDVIRLALEQPPVVDMEALRRRFDWSRATEELNAFTLGNHA
jgi:glycosyltransferase involved in cell wall biosynthesis